MTTTHPEKLLRLFSTFLHVMQDTYFSTQAILINAETRPDDVAKRIRDFVEAGGRP